MTEKIIKHRLFTWFEEMDSPTEPGQLRERVNTLGQKVDITRDVGNGIVKSAVFGVICTGVALYQGYETQATPEGVAYATTRTVVFSSLAVLAMDFILTAMMFSTS